MSAERCNRSCRAGFHPTREYHALSVLGKACMQGCHASSVLGKACMQGCHALSVLGKAWRHRFPDPPPAAQRNPRRIFSPKGWPKVAGGEAQRHPRMPLAGQC